MTAILEPQSAQVGDTLAEPGPSAPASLPDLAVPAPGTLAAPGRPPRVPRVRPDLTTRGTQLFAVAMVALYIAAVAAQPAPDGPDPVAPWWDELIANGLLVGLLALVAGGVAGRRWTLLVGLAVGATLLVASATCPLEGHHEIAAWWFVQLAVGVAMTVLPAVLLRRTQKSG
jgi:peptidoglycan/LPS O-acetylase OafA/YrhL